MIGPVEKKPTIRIAGYLEKKGKTKLVVCRWKRWWFVLEGRLLLYYKSQLEYLNLSPCRGSLNMGLASTVRPGKGLELTVITRSQSVTLRAANKVDHDQWLQSLVDAMALPYSMHNYNSRPVMHFRYATQDYHENLIDRVKSFRSPGYSAVSSENSTNRPQSVSCETSTSSSHSSSIGQTQSDRCLLRRVFSDSRTLLQRPYKRSSNRNSTRLGKIAFSDTSIPVSTRMSPASSRDKCHSMQDLRESEHVKKKVINSDNTAKTIIDAEKTISDSKENKLSNSIKIELNLEDVGTKSGEEITEQKIGNIKITLDGCTIYGSRKSSTEKGPVGINTETNNKQTSQDFLQNVGRKLKRQLSNKEYKSDSDLSLRKPLRTQSLSCENMQTLDRSIGSTHQEVYAKLEIVEREQRMTQVTSSNPGRKTNKRRSNSILSRFIDSKTADEVNGNGTIERQRTIRKRLSFLRKMWKRREKKNQEDEEEDEEFETIDYESIPIVIELPNPDVQKPEQLLSSLRLEEIGPEPEPPPDYDISISEELEVPPMLPPRQKCYRPPSPWHDIPRNNQPVLPPEDDCPPPLPQKTKNQKPHQLVIKIEQTPSVAISDSAEDLPTADSDLCEPPSADGEQKLKDLETLLVQLAEVNTYVVQHIESNGSKNGHCNVVQISAIPEPIYDVPRPHISLIATIQRQNVCNETFTATHFLCTTPLVDVDSLDPVSSRLEAEMTPDSLECDSPWSLTQSEFQFPSHSDSTHTSLSLQRHFISAEDKLFPDSLNS